MATQADAISPEITAENVGYAFLTQFYHILHTTPELVHNFYTDESTMTRPGPNGTVVTVTALDGIKNLLLSLDCINYKAEILTADTQASHMNGVIVLVNGCLTGQDNVRRKFTESFFLAPQVSGFFVLNNAFRFIDGDSLPVADPVEKECDKITPEAPVRMVALVQETAEVADSFLENNTTAVKETVETIALPTEQHKSTSLEKAVPEPSADSTPAKLAAEASANGDVNAPKKSYASLLMNGKQTSSAFPEHVRATPAKPVKRNVAPKSVLPAQQTPSATVPSAVAPVAAAKSPTALDTNGNASSNGHANSNGHMAAKGHSIYIGSLPFDATPALVESEFKRFGHIKKNGIQVRSNKGYVFGFVEYEDVSAQQDALKMGVIQIGDRDVQIQEKRTASQADDYSGRGGYRNDGYRRGNYSNGRGYARNDYAKRNGEGAPRGRGNGDGYGYQNGGGRGTRQVGAPQ